MTDDEIKYKAFLVVYKVLGQTRPGISFEERFLTALKATSGSNWERAKRLNWSKIERYKGKLPKRVFSDALHRRI